VCPVGQSEVRSARCAVLPQVDTRRLPPRQGLCGGGGPAPGQGGGGQVTAKTDHEKPVQKTVSWGAACRR